MKKTYPASYKALLIFPLVLFFLFSIGLAEKRPSDSDIINSLSTSKKLITLHLAVPGRDPIIVSQYENKMITTGPIGGDKIGITPRILDHDVVALDFVRITKNIKQAWAGGETIISLGSIELKSAHAESTPTSLISSIKLIGISSEIEGNPIRVGFRQDDNLKKKYSPYLRGPGSCPCCVTCDGQQTCGAGVTLSCGSCICD